MSFFIWEKVLANHKDINKRLSGIEQICVEHPESKLFLTALAFGLTEAEFTVKTSGLSAEPLADEKYQAIFRDKLLPVYQKWAADHGKTVNPALGTIPIPPALAKAYWFKSGAAVPLLRVVNNCLPFDYDAKRLQQGAVGVEFYAPSENRIFLARPAGQPSSPGTPLAAGTATYNLLVQNAYLSVALNYHDLAGEVAGMPAAEFPDRFQEVETTLMKLGITGDKVARHCNAKGKFLIVQSERRLKKTGMLAISDNKGGEYYVDFVNDDDDPRESISSLLAELCNAAIQLMSKA